MKYDFNKISHRFHTSSVKWDVLDNELPMWVADMDFLVLDDIKKAIKDAADMGSYGYTYPTEEFFKAYQLWWKKRHNLSLDIKDMVYCSGVVSALDSLINHTTNKGDAIMLLTPVYSGFFSVINNNQRHLVTSDLIIKDDEYFINYQDVENKIKKEKVKAIIFCNPQNPIGKIWSKEEISKLYGITKKYDVMFISDEIHCDIVAPYHQYVPALSVSDDIITCLAPSKVFNLAGLQSAVIVIKNEELRKLAQESFYHDDVGEPNYFAIPATIAAYEKGDQYVDEMNAYIEENKRYVYDYLDKNIPEIKAFKQDATYLMWLNIAKLNIKSKEFVELLRKQTGLYIFEGTHYGEVGEYFIRMNVATSLDNVKDAMSRLKTFIEKRR